jgi:large subunit ribosomal protein L18
MATGPNYRVPFRRRRKGKTDYKLRKALVVSGLPRLVIRGSLKNIVAQLVKAEIGGDKVIVSAFSGELTKKYDWQGNCGNLSAAYLTGLLCGYKAIAQGFKEAVLDIGLQYPSKGSRVFAALKGVLDAGVNVPHDKDKLPSKERIEGQHIVEYAKQLLPKQDAYQKQFSEQLARGLRPEELSNHFAQVRDKIVSSFKMNELSGSLEEKLERMEGKT